MEKRAFGKTGLQVTPLGFGAAEIGFVETAQKEVDALLNGLLDRGINVIDTAACYGDSEVKVGQAVSARRDDYVLISKCGHHVEDDDPPNYAAAIVRKSAERSLKRLKTDHLDVLLIHSCPMENLRDEAFVGELEKCKRDGLARFIGYSGDNEELEHAIGMGIFDAIETSVNFCDQSVLERNLPAAHAANAGVIVKRPIANACWRDAEDFAPFYQQYMAPYVERLAAMGFTPASLGFDGGWAELALRFSIFQPGAHVAITGGRNARHVGQNLEAIAKGPLPPEITEKIRQAWRDSASAQWTGQT